MTAETPTPALGFSIVANLGGDRQATVQFYVGRDDEVRAIHLMTDRVMAVLDRQKAKYELKDMREEVITLSGKLDQFRADKEKILKDFGIKLAYLGVQAGTLNEDGDSARNEAYDAHVKTGRTAEFKPVGHVKAQLERIEGGKRQVADEIAKQEAEQVQAVHGVNASIAMHEKALIGFEKQIAEREALLALD